MPDTLDRAGAEHPHQLSRAARFLSQATFRSNLPEAHPGTLDAHCRGLGNYMFKWRLGRTKVSYRYAHIATASMPIGSSGIAYRTEVLENTSCEGQRISAEGESRCATEQTHVPLGARARFGERTSNVHGDVSGKFPA